MPFTDLNANYLNGLPVLYDNPEYQTLPDLLRDTSSSLYEAFRSQYMNAGGSIKRITLDKAQIIKRIVSKPLKK